MSKYILAHDLGTSGNKATLYDTNGKLCASSLYEYPTYYPNPNWVEQDSNDWWKAVCVSTKDLIDKSKISNKDIACVSFSGQMMGCLLVDKKGEALRNMIIWADMRSVKQAERIEHLLGMEKVYKITGHRVSPSYSAAKLLWIRDNQPEIYKKAHKILNAKDFIIHKLTGKFVTDYSDASGMNLFDIRSKKWSSEILKALDIEQDLLPELHKSSDIVGNVTLSAASQTGLLQGTPVVVGGGDGSCACVGAGVVQEGRTYNVLGSSSWISLASKEPIFDSEMRTFNWVHLDPEFYTPCGTMQTAAYSLSWLKDTLCAEEIIAAKKQNKSPYELIDEKVMKSPAGANKLLFLPYLLGERCPRWNADAKGSFIGMTIRTTKEDILRSVLEGVGYNLKVILDIFDKANPIDEISIIGGGAKGKVWLQILSDIWQKPLLVPEYIEEATSMGAAICGGVGIGAFENFRVINKFNAIKSKVTPNPENKELYSKLYSAFNDSYLALEEVFSKLSNI